MISMISIMNNLCAQRPIFHSEADFQHSLAWEIHNGLPDSSVRLELPWSIEENQNHLDIWIASSDFKIAIELKYKTRGLKALVNREFYSLKDQSAQDIGRYDFLKDVMRLEQLIKKNNDWTGFAILLTNDSSYWKIPNNFNTIDANFRLHEGKTILGNLSWGAGAASGTIRDRESPINLNNSYHLNWNDYSRPSSGGYSRFRFLLLQVN